ncbi:helix-turn-helix domain-containing protein [Streptomyces sp. NPDC059063]|uniref:helix-turn-helix domain-containing protein n=1 Tax=unclassified Streptomyces TaxID=2593676 RepID=UPI0036C98520
MTPDELRRVSSVRHLAACGDARTIRKKRRVSLRELAEAIDTSPSSLSRWENGRTAPRSAVALRWAAALDFPTTAQEEPPSCPAP